MGDFFFNFKDVFNLNVHFLHHKGVLILGYFFVSKGVALKDPKKGLKSNGTQLLYQQLY